jgi:hypothetical protein
MDAPSNSKKKENDMANNQVSSLADMGDACRRIRVPILGVLCVVVLGCNQKALAQEAEVIPYKPSDFPSELWVETSTAMVAELHAIRILQTQQLNLTMMLAGLAAAAILYRNIRP